MRRPTINMSEFIAQHEDQYRMMRKYMTTKRGRRAVDDITAESFKYPAAVSLKATSCLARIAVASAAKKVFTKHQDLIKSPEFLTLCPRAFAVPMPEAAAFQPNQLIEWARAAMGDCNHISFVDLAYYSNLSTKAGMPSTAHFHVHSIRWIGQGQPINFVLDEEVMTNTPSLVAGLKACHALPLRSSMVAGRAIYMAKMPLSEYRVYRRMTEEVDPQTGEIFKVPTEKYFQKKRPIRPGDVAKVMRVLGDRSIQSLAFAGGDGAVMLEDIFRRARRYVDRNPPDARPVGKDHFRPYSITKTGSR